MSIIDTYGELESPEEKEEIVVVEDPVKVVLASYDLFKKIIGGKTKENNWYWDERKIEPVYLQGLNVFVEKAELKPDAGQLEEIINELKKKAEELDGTGVFLSALVNTTKISMLFVDEFPKLNQTGYRLKKNKTIILGPKNTSLELGRFAEGNTINQGTIQHDQGYWARGGNHINQGTTTHQGCYASGGNHINQGTTQYQGWYASGGNHINQGTTTHQGLGATGGNHINQGTTTHQGCYASGGNHINIKTVKESKGKLVIDLSQKQHPLKSQLEQKLDELKFLKQTKKATPEETARIINEYGWQKFDKELDEICGKIKEAYEIR